jgi:hypothetical protein
LFLAVVAHPVLAQQRGRPERIGGKPNLNGIWQAANEAHWNLEGHSAQSLPDFASKMGAIAAIPAGQSFVVGGTIPYLPAALAKRDENRAGWPASDPEAKCYMPGIPRATYMPYPFQIVQGEGDQILFTYTFANANRPVFMRDHQRAPVDLWMGRSNGAWDGDTLVIEVNSNIENTWFDRAGNHHSAAMIVTERYTLIDEHMMQYEATIEDPETFSRPWTIRMPLYRRAEADARLLEFNCVKFSEPLLYGEFTSRDESQAAPSR